MPTIQDNQANIHYSFHHFSKLTYLFLVLHASNVQKKRGIHTEVLFEWLLATIFNRCSIFRNGLYAIV